MNFTLSNVALSTNVRFHASCAAALRTGIVLLGLAAAVAIGSNAFAGQGQAQGALTFSVVIPAHCMEVLGDDEQLESGLRDKRLLCKQKTGQGKPVRVVVAQYARFTPGEPNAVHRAGFE